jgi:small subunit ribosomal protein S20
MALTASAKKRVRRSARRNEINKSRISRTRTSVKKVEVAIAAGDAAAAKKALQAAQPELARSAAKGLVHKKTAARKMSRLSARIKKLSA